MRVNLIQKFLLLNLVWHLLVGLYFGYWFSERLISNVTRLHTSYLTEELRRDVTDRLLFEMFNDPPADPAKAAERLTSIERQISSFFQGNDYRIQTLWNRKESVWSNRKDLIGLPLPQEALVDEALNDGRSSADLESPYNGIAWMWNSLVNEEAVINDASSYLRLLIPIQFSQASMIKSATSPAISPFLQELIQKTPPGGWIVPGLLELKMGPQDILQRTVRTVNSVWKRVGVIYMLSNIVLFGLFKSAFNTIQRQSRELHEQERLSNLGKMASYLAHEIRNPLFIIRGSAQTIEETVKQGGAQAKLARYIIEEVDRLNNMVQDLLGLVKPRLAPSRRPTSLSQAITDSADRSLKQAPKMELVPQLDPDHDLIWFNREQLIQVFTNLFRNARDACKGSGTILVESRVTGGGGLQIRITDDGPGIPEANLQSVFDPFFTGKKEGTGLGLAIVRHLVTGNNGTIEAVKPAGTGACFIMTVRLAPEGASESDLEEGDEVEPLEIQEV